MSVICGVSQPPRSILQPLIFGQCVTAVDRFNCTSLFLLMSPVFFQSGHIGRPLSPNLHIWFINGSSHRTVWFSPVHISILLHACTCSILVPRPFTRDEMNFGKNNIEICTVHIYTFDSLEPKYRVTYYIPSFLRIYV